MFYCKSLCKFTFSSGLNELKKWEVILTTIPYSCVLHFKGRLPESDFVKAFNS